MKKITILLFSLILLSVLSNNTLAQEAKTTETFTLDAFAQKLSQSTNPQILDVRSPAEFKENHLKGAVNFYAPDDDTFAKGIENLKKDKPVFVYSINNGRSTTISKKLREAGFKEVYPLPGGLAHWIGAGKPIESEAGRGLTQQEFDKLVSSDNVVLVDIGSKHCGGCKKLEPVVDEVSKAQAIKVVKIDLYDNRQLAKELGIESVPTLILYKSNKAIWRKSGTITKIDIVDALDQSL